MMVPMSRNAPVVGQLAAFPTIKTVLRFATAAKIALEITGLGVEAKKAWSSVVLTCPIICPLVPSENERSA